MKNKGATYIKNKLQSQIKDQLGQNTLQNKKDHHNIQDINQKQKNNPNYQGQNIVKDNSIVKKLYSFKKILIIQLILSIVLVILKLVVFNSNKIYIQQNSLLKSNIKNIYLNKIKSNLQGQIVNKKVSCQNKIDQLKKNSTKLLQQFQKEWQYNFKQSYVKQRLHNFQKQMLQSIAKPYTQQCQKKLRLQYVNSRTITYDYNKNCQHLLERYRIIIDYHLNYFRWLFGPQYKQQFVNLPSQKQPFYPSEQQLQKLQPGKDLIIVTPAGRKQNLQILYLHLLKQSKSFLQWNIWVCTSNQQDLKYIKLLSKKHNWIKLIEINIDKVYLFAKFNYFFKTDLIKNKVYLKLDDDVLWIDDKFIQTMWNHRFKLVDRLIIYPNIINNSILNHLNQRCGAFQYPFLLEYFFDGQSFYKPNVGITIHKQFLQSIKNNDTQRWKCFYSYQEKDYFRISINGFLYHSETVRTLPFQNKHQDELVYSVIYPRTFNSPAVVVGDAIMVHGAFNLQRTYFQIIFPGYVQKYKQIAQKL